MQMICDYDPDTDLITLEMGELVITVTVPQAVSLMHEIEGALWHAYENQEPPNDDKG